MRFILGLLAVLLCAGAVSTEAAHTQAQLVLAAETARAGDTVLAGVHLHMDPRWHTYWKNSGGSGQPTKIEWQLPPGVTADEINHVALLAVTTLGLPAATRAMTWIGDLQKAQ